MNKPAPLKKGDLVIVISALLLACIVWLAASSHRGGNGAQGLVAEIYMDGQLTRTISLSEKEQEQELRLESTYGYNVLQVGPQGARIIEADCRNQDCVHTGMQNLQGGVIACLPHRLLIRLSGGKGAKYDAITR